MFVKDKNNYKYSFFLHYIRYFDVYFKMISQTLIALRNTSYNFIFLIFITPRPTFFFQSVDLWLHSCLNTNVSHHFHQLSLLWHFSFPICGKTLQHCLLHRRTNLLIISFSAWICPNWINPVSRCGIHLTPPGFWRTLPPLLPPLEQQIVKSVDSLDSLAKKADFIIEVIAGSLKVIHSPSQRQSLVCKVTC